ncbi:MAG: GHKL domain-containing protein [Candidatus Omnitrophica bacterium]|nr:GHKL domain-containing protein [Candidatus Omnitrophota bacterium]
MEKGHRTQRIRVFIILRLFIAALLLFLAHYVFKLEILIFYYLIAAISVLSLIYLGWLIYGKGLTFLMWIQIIFDLLLETALVYYTGGVDSLFAPIYVLSILSAGMFIAPWSSFLVAGLSSFLFSGLVILNYFRGIPTVTLVIGTPSVQSGNDVLYIFYATYVRVTIFFIVAILTNYMTETILHLENRIRLQERLAFVGDITSRIAHEIKNPLAAISNTLEVIMEDLKSNLSEKNLKLMSAVIDESERLKRVFGKILDYSRVGELRTQKIPLNQLIDKVLLLFSTSKEFEVNNVFVEKKYNNKNVMVLVDPEQMIDAFSNIIRNAYEAMPHGGVLTIEINEYPEAVELIIADTGEGIKKEIRKALFTPFKTTKRMGTGLGLAQVHKIVSLHHGKVEVESNEPKGTQVRILLKRK